MKKEEKISIFKKIIKKNTGLLTKISEDIGISFMTIWRISSNGSGKIENKEKIMNYLTQNNYIKEGQYTITEFFNI